MKYSARLVTALAAVVLLVAAVVGLNTGVRATHGPTHTDGQIYLTNEWSKITTEVSPPSSTGRTYVGAGKTLYATFEEVSPTATSTVTNLIETDSNKIRVTVIDADQNVPVTATTTVTFPSSTTTSGSVSFPLPLASPIIDRDGDGSVVNDAGDVTLSGLTSGSVFVSGVLESDGSTNGGVVTVSISTAVGPSATMTITWSTSAVDTLTTGVTHTSSQGATAIAVVLTETGRSTGRFEGVITLFDNESGTASTASTRGIQSGGILTVEYNDTTPVSGTSKKVSATAVAETVAPVLSVTGPAHSLETKDRQILFSGNTSDATSGLRIARQFVFIDDDDDAADAAAVDTATTGNTDLQVTATLTSGTVDGATSAGWSFTPGSTQLLPNPAITTPNNIVDWQFRSTDLAGNVSILDSDSTTAGTQNYKVKIDQVRPSITDVFTGHFWDTSLTTAALGQNKATSIEALFDGNVDFGSISASDFEVVIDGTTHVPSAADTYSGAKDSVFLTVPVLVASSKPTVKIVGQVSDSAGNIETSGSKAAVDSLAPTLTVTLSGGSAVASPASATNDKITVTITSDESLSSDPTIQVYAPGSVAEGAAVTAISQGGNVWKATLTKTSSAGARAEGKKAIVVTATDQATAANRKTVAIAPNTGTKGSADTTSSSAIAYSLDTVVPGLTITPADASTTDEVRPFVILDWGEAIATINKATFDGTDISASLSASSDRKKWIYKPASDLTLAKHTIIAQATDDAGNKSAELTKAFTVAARAAFSLPLNPGWNLVSLRSEPADTSINSVITVKDVSTVITYDPTAVGGPWLVATRGADGKLAGSLTTIDGRRGYWINTTSFEAIKVLDPKPTGGSLPPAIPVSAGWNLVPARDLTASLGAGVSVGKTAAQYFNNVKVTRAYWYDTLAGTFNEVSLATAGGTNITVGVGYWVYATEAGAIVP